MNSNRDYATENINLKKRLEVLKQENKELKEKAKKYDELCSHNVMENQNFGDDLIQGILALNKRVIERNKKFIKIIEILKKYYKFKLFPPAMDNIPEISISTDWEHYISQQEYELLKEVLGE